jgi:hypothetical protein
VRTLFGQRREELDREERIAAGLLMPADTAARLNPRHSIAIVLLHGLTRARKFLRTPAAPPSLLSLPIGVTK